MSTESESHVDAERRGLELEYETLRSEILKRVEMRQQIVAVTLTLAGVFLGVGLGTESVALIYPPLATLLAFNWAQNDYRIRAAARYIRHEIEGKMPGLNFETHTHRRRGTGEGLASWRFIVLSHGGIILVTQLLAIGIELFKFTFDPLEWVLLGIDLVAVLLVGWIMTKTWGWWRKRTRSKEPASFVGNDWRLSMYVIRYRDLKKAIDPERKLVKLSDPNMWKKPWPEGTREWQAGHEIRSESIGISLFTTGTEEKLHYYKRTWELYQVLAGSLKIAVKPFRKGSWSAVILNELDMILLAPGTLHLVDASSQHTTQVIQAPPALSDQIVVDDQEEIDAAVEVLGAHKVPGGELPMANTKDKAQ